MFSNVGPAHVVLLAAVLIAVLAVVAVLAQHRVAHHRLYDALTGLANRRLLTDRVTAVLGHARRASDVIGLVVVDLDRFKDVNDGLGTSAGDVVLRVTAERAATAAGPWSSVGRLGSDEFAVLCRASSEDELVALAHRVRAAVIEPITCHGSDITMAASVGLAIAQDDAVADHLLRDATTAVHAAKASGHGAIQLFDAEMRDRVASRITLERDLRCALAAGELRVHYQPAVDLRSGAIVGAEALLRWQHPTQGLVPPLDFLPIAEETGLIFPIGRFVLEQACRQAKQWQEAGHPIRVSVNLSPRQLERPDLPDVVAHVMATTGVDPRQLCLEITEGVLIAEDAPARAALDRLKDLGVALSIDDFGTGYSSLAYLRSFPVDEIKIDRAFVSSLAGGNSAVVQAILTLAHALSLMVVAEGVEEQDQVDELARLGCGVAQGFLFARPQPAEDVTALLHHPRRADAPAAREG